MSIPLRSRVPVVVVLLAFGCATKPPPVAATPDPQADAHVAEAAAGAVIALFDGHSLSGWHVVGGGATFRVDDGCIVGTAGPGPNTFLCTSGEWSDFELTLDVRLDVPGNSGIQFRSHVRPDGVVYGYQCEIDPSARSWSGGIYDESRRGWLASLEGEAHAAARAAFRVDDWNRYRIRAVGDRLRTWVNDVPCADLIDDADASGLIALQVHTGGTGVIRWRDVRIAPIRPDAP
ncbi:MAG: DUF1080 domain-containing protein [Phycisphaerales bacterium]|nr:DUF1080 domain-containing protein [Phycisphaerales bacterium]